MGFFSKEKKSQPSNLIIQGKKIQCPICDNDQFRDKKILLNTEGMTFLGLDFLNSEATTYTCSRCSHMLYFNFNKEELGHGRL